MEEIIESWLDESDQSSADENDCIQSDSHSSDSSEEENVLEDVNSLEEEPAAGHRPPVEEPASHDFSSEDKIPLSILVRQTQSTEVMSNVTPRRRQYYYGKRRCMKWSSEGP